MLPVERMTEIVNWADPDDRRLARSIFGSEDFPLVAHCLQAWLGEQGFGVARITAIELSIGATITFSREGSDRFVVKVWPGTIDARALAAQIEVQRAMSAAGFPAPGILTPPRSLGSSWAVAMAYDRTGEPTNARGPVVRRAMAAGLARLVREADRFRVLPGLPLRTLPPGGAIWPPPHNALFDFAATSTGAEWIDALGAEALATMRRATSPIVVGHGDWSAKNMRVTGGALAVVYDWDSIALDRETAMLGTAVAHFPTTWELDVPKTPTPAEMAAFVRDYEAARGEPFTSAERAEIEASATYARAYTARCEHAIDPEAQEWDGSSRQALAADGAINLPLG